MNNQYFSVLFHNIQWTEPFVNHFFGQRNDLSHLTTQDLCEVQMKGDEVHMCDPPYNFHLFLILLFSRKASSRRLSFPVPLNYKNYFLSNLPDLFFQIMSNHNRSALILPKTPYDGQKPGTSGLDFGQSFFTAALNLISTKMQEIYIYFFPDHVQPQQISPDPPHHPL